MNYYTLKSVSDTIATIEFVVDNNKIVKKFDARYLPLEDKTALDAYCKNWMDNYTLPTEVAVAISDEVEAIIGKKQAIQEPTTPEKVGELAPKE